MERLINSRICNSGVILIYNPIYLALVSFLVLGLLIDTGSCLSSDVAKLMIDNDFHPYVVYTF